MRAALSAQFAERPAAPLVAAALCRLLAEAFGYPHARHARRVAFTEFASLCRAREILDLVDWTGVP